MRTVELVSLAMVVLIASAAHTQAGVVTYSFAGTLGNPGLNDGVGAPPGMLPAEVTGGSSFTGTLQYVDSVLEDDIVLDGEDFSPHQGHYGLFSGGQALRFSVTFANTLVFDIGPGGSTTVWVVDGNSSATLPDIVAFQRSAVGIASTSHPGLFAQNVTIDLRDTSETAITGDSLQALTPLNLAAFNQRSFTFAGDDDDGLGSPEFSLFGTITSLNLIAQSVPIPTGMIQQALLGGTGYAGGISADLDVGQSGSLTAEFKSPTTSEFLAAWNDADGFSQGNFLIYGDDDPTAAQQLWDLSFSGLLSDSATLQFTYDESRLSDYYLAHEDELGIWHFNSGLQSWEFLRDSIDTQNNTITVTVDGFSPFVLGSGPQATAAPEPSSLMLLATGGLIGVVRLRRRAQSRCRGLGR